jgi:hypothetical protein
MTDSWEGTEGRAPFQSASLQRLASELTGNEVCRLDVCGLQYPVPDVFGRQQVEFGVL